MKKEILNNPFLIAGYQSPAYFCDRESETAKVISALENDRNISLISPRRFGKTGLIHHVFYHLQAQNKDIRCFYLDIFHTQSLHEFVKLFGQIVLGKLDNNLEKTMKQLSAFFKSFRPILSYNSMTGKPELSIDIKPEQTENTLKEIFAYLQQSGKRCYIALDEFQQITEYPEKGVEALLRSYMQFSNNVKFIFAGSKKHLMDAMFSAVNRPFYQSTQKIGLKEIPLETYAEFAIRQFSERGKLLTYSLFEMIYNKVLGHTWYIQFILNQLYAFNKKGYTEQDVNKIISEVLEEENATYKTYCEMLPKGQLSLLRAIAKEQKISNPFQFEFMKKHGLTAPSSVKLALKSLVDKTLILKDDEGAYLVYDRFFSLWLENLS